MSRVAIRVPDVAKVLGVGRTRYERDLRTACLNATDQASKDAQRDLQERIRAVGLGRLSGAVGQTSTKKRRSANDSDNIYGAIYARGGDDSLGGGALEAYSQGAVIRPGPGRSYLAIPTAAVQRYISAGLGRRFRLTPGIFNISQLTSKIGKLEFRPLPNGNALLLIKNVTVSPKDGRALRAGKGRSRTRIHQKEVVAFVLIRETRRTKRFDKDAIVRIRAQQMPDYIQNEMDRLEAARG